MGLCSTISRGQRDDRHWSRAPQPRNHAHAALASLIPIAFSRQRTVASGTPEFDQTDVAPGQAAAA